MIGRAQRAIRAFAQAPGKVRWLDDRLAWKLFQLRQRRQDRINRAFDVAHGTDTAGEMPLVEAGIAEVDAERGNIVYRPLWERNFAQTMRLFRERLGAGIGSFTFVDVGSGKGKLLLLASLHPFRRIRGIDYAPGLHRIAAANIGRFDGPGQACRDVAAELGDATAFRLPDGPVIALIFNAFDTDAMARVMANLVRQRQGATEPTFIVYENVRRAAEIGQGMAVPAPWVTIARSRHRIVVGNAAAAALWTAPKPARGLLGSDQIATAGDFGAPGSARPTARPTS